jgi:hypothetical protein
VNPNVNMIQISTKINIILLILSNNNKINETTNKTKEMCIQYNSGQFSVVVTCLFNSGCFNCMIIVIN